MNKNGVIAVVVVVAAIVLVGLWAMRSGQNGPVGADCSAPPSVPSGLKYTKSGDMVTLAWNPPTVNDGVSAYVIEAGSKSGGTDQGTFVAQGNVTTFQRQAPPGTYHVRMFARNACGTSAPSEELIVQMP